MTTNWEKHRKIDKIFKYLTNVFMAGFVGYMSYLGITNKKQTLERQENCMQVITENVPVLEDILTEEFSFIETIDAPSVNNTLDKAVEEKEALKIYSNSIIPLMKEEMGSVIEKDSIQVRFMNGEVDPINSFYGFAQYLGGFIGLCGLFSLGLGFKKIKPKEFIHEGQTYIIQPPNLKVLGGLMLFAGYLIGATGVSNYRQVSKATLSKNGNYAIYLQADDRWKERHTLSIVLAHEISHIHLHDQTEIWPADYGAAFHEGFARSVQTDVAKRAYEQTNQQDFVYSSIKNEIEELYGIYLDACKREGIKPNKDIQKKAEEYDLDKNGKMWMIDQLFTIYRQYPPHNL